MEWAIRWGMSLVFVAACHAMDPVRMQQMDAGAPDASMPEMDHPLCMNGMSADGLYPQVAYSLEIGGTVSDLSFATTDASGAPSTLALHDYFEPCASSSRLLIIRVSGAWCGTCRWDISHTKEWADSEVGSRLLWLDVLVANEDNLPASLADLPSWQARMDRPGKLAIDPGDSLAPLNDVHEPLPFTVMVDTRTMTILSAEGNDDPDWFGYRIRSTLARLDGVPGPSLSTSPMADGLFDRKQWDLIQDMTPPGDPPPDATNGHADDPAAAALGQQLFSDTSLSPTGTISCATCHDPAKQFADGRPQSQGVALGDRNAPSVLLSSHSRWQFWDGRADTLWAQATGPLENPKEFNSSRLYVAHAVFDAYRSPYEAIFGAMPDLADMNRFPVAGKPGEASWMSMSSDDQTAVTRVLANVGKSIAAYERTLRVKPNRLDAYIGGDLNALTSTEKTGLSTFLSAGCIQCHYGPRLTDDAFHDVRFPTGRQDGMADRGRVDGITQLLLSEFLASGPYSDAPTTAHGLAGLSAVSATLGEFKTPALRGVAGTAPYGHGGTLATLTDVVNNYSTAGLMPADPRTLGATEPWVGRFGRGHVAELVTFLQVLEAEPASP